MAFTLLGEEEEAYEELQNEVPNLIVEELKKVKNKLHEKSWTMIGIAQDRQLLDLYEVDEIINARIAELKGE